MRIKLKDFLHQRITIRGTVSSIGTTKQNKNQYCVSIRDVKHELLNDDLCDHLWFKVGKRLLKDESEIHRGDVIRLDARVCRYTKSSGSMDFGIKYPSRFKVINQNRKMVRENYTEFLQIA